MSPVTTHDLDIAAKTVWGEARGEGDLGMLAVACVLVNRAKLKDAHLADVCLKPFQFSCWNEVDTNKPKIESLTPDDSFYRQAMISVLQAIDRAGSDKDPSRGATHYATITARPWWADKMEMCATIYHHMFFKEKDSK